MEYYLDRECIDYQKTSGSSGKQLNVKTCPVCGRDHYKVYLNAESGLGNCFSGSCQSKFNKYTFIRAHLGNPSFKVIFEHLRAVASELGWMPARTTGKYVSVEESEIKLPQNFDLPIDGKNLAYLNDRGIDINITKYFSLKYCHTGKWKYKKEDGSDVEQNFAGRVLIPVFDLDGELVTFQGRDITGKSEKRYLFPATLPGTGRFLLNGHNAIGAKRVVMGEGPFDVMALKIAIDSDPALRDIVPVGSFGMHLSYGAEDGNDQLGRFLALKAAGLEEVIIMWDGEKNALERALDAAKLLNSVGLTVRIALLPKDADPNEVDKTVVTQAIWKAQTFTNKLYVQWKIKNPYRQSLGKS